MAPARAALAGNPSDGYGGAVLAVAIEQFAAQAVASAEAKPGIKPASELVEATRRRFARALEPRGERSSIVWQTSVPRGVGLGGSSAIVIAALRALCALHGVSLGPDELSRFALAVETEELGIAAGLQDRIAQAYGGLTFMDFGAERYESLDPALLPPLVVAWHDATAADSGVVHDDLRLRYARGDTGVRAAMSSLAAAGRQARDALLEGDTPGFARAVDASFDARQAMIELDPRHVEMIELARAEGAAANYTGSGGAVVAVCRDAEQQSSVVRALRDAGCGVTVV